MNNRTIALIVAAALIAFGVYYYKRNTHRAAVVLETQVDVPCDVTPEVAVEQETAQ